MFDSPILTMALFFSVTTTLVFAFPLVKLAPFWLQRRLHRQLAHHRAAAEALALAMTRCHNDPDQLARLTAQHDWHLAAIAALAPERPVAAEARKRAA